MCRFPELLAHHTPFSADSAAIGPYGAGEIHLRLDRRIANAGGQQRMDGAASGTVDEGQRPTAMNAGERIEQVWPWLTLEDGGARSDLDRQSTRLNSSH